MAAGQWSNCSITRSDSYQIEAKAVAGENDSNPQSDVVRFHQSLTFTDGGSNRSEEAAPRAVALGEGLRAPRRRTAAVRGHDPDLENARRPRLGGGRAERAGDMMPISLLH
jgi:hypothetical protein